LSALTTSIVIPTYNRINSLMGTLEKCRRLNPGPLETIVVDDASCDDTKHVVREDFPEVTYIRLPSNRGQAFARSVGMATASADLIVSLDDDAWFQSEAALLRLAAYAARFERAGVFRFAIDTPVGKSSTTPARPAYVRNHVTCGCAYRAEALDEVGYHLEFIHSGAEETDISLKMLDAGYQILFTPDIHVFHDFDPRRRPPAWHAEVRRNTFRNELIEITVRYPTRWVIPALCYKTLTHMRFGLKHGLLVPSLAALWGFLWSVPAAIALRRPIRPATLQQYLALKKSPKTANNSDVQGGKQTTGLRSARDRRSELGSVKFSRER